jgi:signal transduction histidine kinase
LVALGVALRLARDHATLRGDQALVGDLDGAADELKQALSELRDLAQGIHPAVLTRAGIGPALRILAEVSPIPVEINDAPSERFQTTSRRQFTSSSARRWQMQPNTRAPGGSSYQCAAKARA